MKKFLCFMLLSLLCIPYSVSATSGCCSSHGGINCSYQTSSGNVVCNDGWTGSSCSYSSMSKCSGYNPSIYGRTQTVSYTYGCTDSTAKNYNVNANKDNGSCEYYKYGCTEVDSTNYDATAEKDNGSCIKIVKGCIDFKAENYNPEANTDDQSCIYKKETVTPVTNNLDDKSSKEDNQKSDANSENTSNLLLGLGGLSVIGYFIYRKAKKL